MAWIYLAESAESVWPFSHGLEQWPTVKSSDMHKPYFCPECDRENSKSPPSGMTLGQSQGNCCLQSILFREDSHARTSVLRAVEQVWLESEVAYSSKSSDLPKKLSLLSSSLKTSLQSGQEDSDVWSADFPISGMTVGGRLSRPPQLEPRTSAKDGFYWPTPTAQDFKKRGPNSKQQGLSNVVFYPQHRQTLKNPTGQLNPTWVEWLMGYRTGWTELGDLETQWFRSKQGKRSKN